jgi:hypothetical protein
VSLDDLIEQMKGTEQAKNWTIYEHGLSVANRYRDLYERLEHDQHHTYSWAYSKETKAHLKKIRPLALPPKEVRTYHIYHDCGKPSCLVIDDQGRRHFPGHAERSAELFAAAFPEDERTVRLIRKDMLCHTVKGEAINGLIKDLDCPTLLLTAWAELHSNAEHIFGGFESDSFKIKRKQLEKISRRLAEVI